MECPLVSELLLLLSWKQCCSWCKLSHGVWDLLFLTDIKKWNIHRMNLSKAELYNKVKFYFMSFLSMFCLERNLCSLHISVKQMVLINELGYSLLSLVLFVFHPFFYVRVKDVLLFGPWKGQEKHSAEITSWYDEVNYLPTTRQPAWLGLSPAQVGCRTTKKVSQVLPVQFWKDSLL